MGRYSVSIQGIRRKTKTLDRVGIASDRSASWVAGRLGHAIIATVRLYRYRMVIVARGSFMFNACSHCDTCTPTAVVNIVLDSGRPKCWQCLMSSLRSNAWCWLRFVDVLQPTQELQSLF